MPTNRWLIGAIFILFCAQSGCGDDGTDPAPVPDPACEVSTTSLDFGSLPVGATADLTFTIENTGGGTLSGTVAETCDDFAIVGEASYSLGADEIATLTVRFAPATTGDKACALQIGSGLCGGVSCAGVAEVAADFYVSAASGLDANPGTFAEPFQTITHAVAAAGEDQVIHVRPGTYDAALGETFPIALRAGQTLIGDVANRGLGNIVTHVYGSGDADPAPGNDDLAAILGADGATVTGLAIGAPYAVATFGIHLIDVALTVSHNTFISGTSALYGGIRARGDGASVIDHNDFQTTGYGVYCAVCTGGMLIEANYFQAMPIPLDLSGSANNTIIRGNTIVGNGQMGIQVQAGVPLIEGNTFNKPAGYTTYGAIRCWFDNANPTIRDNTFICARGICVNDGLSSPDIGTAGDPGANDFSGVTGEPIYHGGAAALFAIGNVWPQAVPVCGTDIVLTGAGSVTWGVDSGETCP